MRLSQASFILLERIIYGLQYNITQWNSLTDINTWSVQ